MARITRTSTPLPTVAAAAATTTVAPVAPTAYTHPSQLVVGFGPKPANVRAGTAQNNVASWALVVAYLQANGGTCTVGALAAHLAAARNHASFAAYAVRNGWLAPPSQPTVVATAADLGL